MVLIVCLRIRMPHLSEGLILHERSTKLCGNTKYEPTAELRRQNFGRQSRQSRSAFTSLGMKADLKCETTDLLQSMQKGSVEAELPMFGNGRQSVSGEADIQIFGSQD